MTALGQLLRWQWLAYWRRILRGSTSARGNLVIVGLLAIPGFARYFTFLRDVKKQTAGGSTALLELLLAAILLICLQPGWDAAKLAMAPRDMARFPLSAAARFGLRVLSRFISPIPWIFTVLATGAIWPLLALPHPVLAIAGYLLFATGAFAAGLVLADLAQTARASVFVRLTWMILAAAAAGWWFVMRTFPPLPSQAIIAAGQGQWLVLPIGAAVLGASVFLAFRALGWMLDRSPPAERSRPVRSARKVTIFRRELWQYARLPEVRTTWAIVAAVALYLVAADRPEPDALRVMLGVLAFRSIALAMNRFGLDGVPGLDRLLLFPVSAQKVLALRNAAFATAVSGPAIPLAMLAAVRFGWREGTGDLLEGLALCLAMLAWGNITSVLRPENAESGSGGDVVDQFLALAIIGVTTGGAILAMRSNAQTAPLYLFAPVIVLAAMYAASLRWSAAYFGRNYETIRSRIG